MGVAGAASNVVAKGATSAAASVGGGEGKMTKAEFTAKWKQSAVSKMTAQSKSNTQKFIKSIKGE